MKKTLQHLVVLLVLQISIYSQAGTFIGGVSPDSLTGYGYTWSTPLIMDGNLYWAGQDQGFIAMNLDSGEKLWLDTLNFNNGTYDSPVGYDGKVFIGKKDYSDNNNYALLALDAETGSVIWEKSGFMFYNNQCNKPIDPDAETIFAASTDSLYCFNIDDGSVVWQDSGQYKQLILDYENSTLYAARADSAKIEIINPATGVFTGGIILPDSMSFISSMALAEYESNSYLVTMPDRNWSVDSVFTYCFNLTNPAVVWASAKIGYVGNSVGISIMDGLVFAGVEKPVADTTQYVRAFDLLTGEIKWEVPVGRSGATNTVYTVALDGKVYFESNFEDNDRVLCVDAATGNEIWSGVPGEMPENGFFAWGSPLIYNNTLYLATDASGIYWFNAGVVEGEWTMVSGNILGTNSYIEGLSTDIETESGIVPAGFSLSQNYPNPFNPTTSIEYRVSSTENVSIKVYDMLGREVMTLVNKTKSPGSYNVTLDASKLASGVYFYRLTAGDFIAVRKMVLLK